MSTTLNGNGYPESASVSWAVGVVGVGQCNLTAPLSWHNQKTGARGEKAAHIPRTQISLGSPNPVAHPCDAIIATGSGPIEYTLTINGGAVAGPIVVDTVDYAD